MKVFSREKYLRVMDEICPDEAEMRRQFPWPFECEGKTKEECNLLGFGVHADWMEEKDMGYKEKQVEWLKANNLKEGSRVCVYRKPESYEDGWRYPWVEFLMDDMVGKVAHIMEVTPCSLKVKVDGHSSYMPYTALYPAPEPTYAECQAEWVKKNGVKEGTRIRITKDFDEDSDASAIGHTGVAGRCGSVSYVGNSYINVYLDSEEVYFLTVPYYAMEVIKESKQTYEPITGFETGKWYVCHLNERPSTWNLNGEMDGLLDGKPHKCVIGNETFAEFEDIPLRGEVGWSFYGDMDYFEEVPSPVTSYSERQAEWVKQNNIKGGTKVRFTKNFTTGEDGSGCCGHQDAKGMEGVIISAEDDYLFVLVPGLRSWLVPFTALEVIKEPTYRPYNNDELNDLVGKVLTQKGCGYPCLVTQRYSMTQVYVNGYLYNAQQLLELFALDGKPCGIKEEEK